VELSKLARTEDLFGLLLALPAYTCHQTMLYEIGEDAYCTAPAWRLSLGNGDYVDSLLNADRAQGARLEWVCERQWSEHATQREVYYGWIERVEPEYVIVGICTCLEAAAREGDRAELGRSYPRDPYYATHPYEIELRKVP
jgi:hypothetical protein